MRRENNLLSRVVDFNNLYRAFLAASHGKRERPEVREFEYHLETRLWEIRDTLAAGEYAWALSTASGSTIRSGGRSGRRRFATASCTMRSSTCSNPIFRRGFIADSYACIPLHSGERDAPRGGGYRAFVRARAGRGYRVQVDVKHYFASVEPRGAPGTAGAPDRRPPYAEPPGRARTHGAERPGLGMPIGSLASQLFANVYLDALDHFVKEGLRVRPYPSPSSGICSELR